MKEYRKNIFKILVRKMKIESFKKDTEIDSVTP